MFSVRRSVCYAGILCAFPVCQSNLVYTQELYSNQKAMTVADTLCESHNDKDSP